MPLPKRDILCNKKFLPGSAMMVICVFIFISTVPMKFGLAKISPSAKIPEKLIHNSGDFQDPHHFLDEYISIGTNKHHRQRLKDITGRSNKNIIKAHHANNIAKQLHDADELKDTSENSLDNEQSIKVDVDVSRIVAKLPHFWASTGFCPPAPHQEDCAWFLGDDMRHNLAYIGAVPHSGIKNVRIHFLLDAVYVISRSVNGSPVYNFTCLDKFIQHLHDNGLKPGFELMGNPSGYYDDFEKKTQIYEWRDLVREIAQRYINIYGLDLVKTWNFESWNEPKLRSFDRLNFTLQGFLNYYDACSEGLHLASPWLRFGAPSGGCSSNRYDPDKYCWALLDHLDHGKNYFTGQSPVRVDYISIHKKGNMPYNTDVIMAKEAAFVQVIRDHMPRLVTVPLFNDEGDPLVTWSRPLSWRADNRYSSMVVKVINTHQQTYFHGNHSKYPQFHLLSNDNGFLSYQPAPFSQRTLLARFQVNNTKPRHTQFVRKPAHTVMGLLALLGDHEVKASWNRKALHKSFCVLASVHNTQDSTQDSWQMSAILYYSIDTRTERSAYRKGLRKNVNLRLNIKNIPDNNTNILCVVYSLSSNHGNPYKVWSKAGKPPTPSPALFNLMRQHEDPVLIHGPSRLPTSGSSTATVKLNISLASVTLVHVCNKPEEPPGQVIDVVIYNVTCNQVLIVWNDDLINKCVLHYDVEFRQSSQEEFHKINPNNSIATIYNYSPTVMDTKADKSCTYTHGFYRVRAVDYWGRPGQYSPIVRHPGSEG